MSLELGDLIDGKYRLIRLIGEGGWGSVYEGENTRTLRRVAIKVLRPQFSASPDMITRFEREAQAAGRIGSEHIVEVFDLGSLPDGTHFMVMELLVGEDLSTRLERLGGRMDPIETVGLIHQLLLGLGAAHEAGIVHRDLKPENLFIVPMKTGEEFLKILDFGISKFNKGSLSTTKTGAVLGTPYYMAPEQARGQKHLDARTDLYAVGVVLFQCVVGRVPFDGDNFNDLMFRIVLEARPDPLQLRPDLDPALAAIVVKAIACAPEGRYQSAAELDQALMEWLSTKGVASPSTPNFRKMAKSVPAFALTPQPMIEPARQPTPIGSSATLPLVQQKGANVASAGANRSSTTGATTSTPQPSASTQNDALEVKRGRPPMALIAGGALAVLAVLGIGISMSHKQGASVDTAATHAPLEATSLPPATSSLATPAPVVPPETAPATNAAAAVGPDATPPTAASSAAHPVAPSARGKAHVTPAAPTSLKVADTPSASAPPSAAAPAAAPTTAIDGRSIRTGL